MCSILGEDRESKITQKNRTLEGKNWMLGRDGGSKIIKNLWTSLMEDPQSEQEYTLNGFLLVALYSNLNPVPVSSKLD